MADITAILKQNVPPLKPGGEIPALLRVSPEVRAFVLRREASTVAANQRRMEMMKDPTLVSVMRCYWSTHKAIRLKEREHITKEEFVELRMSLSKALRLEWDMDGARIAAIEEWEDCCTRGLAKEDEMGFQGYCKMLFELVEGWQDEREDLVIYTCWLWKIFRLLTSRVYKGLLRPTLAAQLHGSGDKSGVLKKIREERRAKKLQQQKRYAAAQAARTHSVAPVSNETKAPNHPATKKANVRVIQFQQTLASVSGPKRKPPPKRSTVKVGEDAVETDDMDETDETDEAEDTDETDEEPVQGSRGGLVSLLDIEGLDVSDDEKDLHAWYKKEWAKHKDEVTDERYQFEYLGPWSTELGCAVNAGLVDESDEDEDDEEDSPTLGAAAINANQ